VDIEQVMQDPGRPWKTTGCLRCTLTRRWLITTSAAYVSIIAVIMVALTLARLVMCWVRGRLPGERWWWIPLALIPIAVFAAAVFFFKTDVESVAGSSISAVSVAVASGGRGADGDLCGCSGVAARINAELASHCRQLYLRCALSHDDRPCGMESVSALR